MEGGGGGAESWQDDSTQQNGRGVESSRDDTIPRGGRDPEGDKTPGAPPASQSRGGEDGQGRVGGGETQPPTRPTQEQEPDGGEGAAPRGATESRGGGDSADAGYSPAQTPDAAQAVAKGAQERARPALVAGTRRQTARGDDTPRSTGTSRRGGDNDNDGHLPAQNPVAAQAASEGA